MKSLLIRLSLAIGLSAAVLAVFIVLQGTLLFPEYVETLRNPTKATVLRLSPSSDGQTTVVLLWHAPRVGLDAVTSTVGVWSVADSGCSFRKLPFAYSPFNAVAARSGRHVFASSKDGRVYALDLASPTSLPRLLGIHNERFLHTLECSHDGSIVIGTDGRILCAWRPIPPGRLWRRDDLDVTCAFFYGQRSRLFCGLTQGDVCELDGLTGATLRTFPSHCSCPLSLDFSADGTRLAALDHNGELVVGDLATNQPLWRRRFRPPVAGPRFSPDGELVIAPLESRRAALLVLSAATGQQLAELTGAKAQVAGIEVSENGVVYAWSFFSGTVTAWNIASGSLVGELSVECLPASVGSL